MSGSKRKAAKGAAVEAVPTVHGFMVHLFITYDGETRMQLACEMAGCGDCLSDQYREAIAEVIKREGVALQEAIGRAAGLHKGGPSVVLHDSGDRRGPRVGRA
jgi:hypothetical protein